MRLRANLPSLFSAEGRHIQGSFEATGEHVAFSCSVTLPYAPVVRSVKKAAHMTKNKAIALRDHIRKPQPQPIKRITPEPVGSSSQDTEYRPPDPSPRLMADIPGYVQAQMEERGLTKEDIQASYRASLPDTEPDLALEVPEAEEAEEEEEKHEALASLGTASNPIYWESTCFEEEHDYADDASVLRALFDRLSFENDVLDPLIATPRQDVIDNFILPFWKSPCYVSKRLLALYVNREFLSHPCPGVDALVLYRRHSTHLKPHLTHAQIDLLESSCNFLLCLLRNAGFHVTHTGHQQ